jgi:hypothetical protein
MALLAAAAIPQTLVTIDASRAQAAARFVSSRMMLARMQAVTRARAVAIRFDRDPLGYRLATFADGNHNGVLSRDIQRGVDRPLDEPVRLFQLFPGVDFALVADGGSGDPIQIGNTTLLSFGPTGAATSGTIYIRGRDGSQYAIRVLGATGRVRLQRYDERQGQWTDRF